MPDAAEDAVSRLGDLWHIGVHRVPAVHLPDVCSLLQERVDIERISSNMQASIRSAKADEDLASHSTVKPTALVMDFLLDCSHPGELVVDPCLGSGTTLLAAHRTGRRGSGIELDPLYCDLVLKRFSADMGVEPVLAGDGRNFAEVAEERRVSRESKVPASAEASHVR